MPIKFQFQTHLTAVLLGLVSLLVVMFVLLSGSVAAQATSFSASLSGDAEVPPLASDAGGNFSATLSDGTLDFTLTSDAMGITQAHIHLGAADANGGVVAFLFGFEDGGVDGVDVSGSITADDVIGDIAGDFDALVAALNTGEAYVNVHTVANPPGEVRGQIAATINPLAVYESQLALFNAGDFEAGLAVFAPDAVGGGPQVCGPAPTCDPRPAIENAIAGGAWEGATFVIVEGSTTIEGNRLTAKVQNFFPALLGPIGYERTQIDVTVEVNDAGLISLWSVTPDTSDPETVAILAAFAAGSAAPEPVVSEPEPEAISAPDGLPSAGGGGLVADKDPSTWFAIGLASGLAGLVVLGSVSARVAVRRRR